MGKSTDSRIRVAASLCIAACAAMGVAATAAAANEDLTELSLEQLMQEPVTSVSKKPTRLNQSAAAIYVVTQDDIRRLGINSLPDALRLVPGLDVAQISANEWAVSARGFNDQFANTLLVLIDGRTVYSPGSAGVSWNSQDVMMEDVDRIEVIRGPGATLWGSNAVNGVINVITKRAQDSQGLLIAASAASVDQQEGVARYGGTIGSDVSYRMYAKYLNQDGFLNAAGGDTGDRRAARTGFRVDSAFPGADQFTVQGDIFSDQDGQALNEAALTPPGSWPTDAVNHDNGSNLLGRWTHDYSGSSSSTLQTYVDHVDQGVNWAVEHLDTYDIDLQHDFLLGASNHVLWGSGFRLWRADEVSSSPNIVWSPQRFDVRLFDLFVQDDWTVIPDRLRVTAGSKFEHSSLAGWNPQPNLRVTWTPTEWQTAWAAVSRATRTPSLAELNLRVNVEVVPGAPGTLPGLVSVIPNRGLEPEQLTAYELGYRLQPTSSLSFDISGFVNHYSSYIEPLEAGALFEGFPVPHILIPLPNENTHSLTSHGVEVTGRWQVLHNWAVTGSYTWLNVDAASDDDLVHENPRHQFNARSYLDLPFDLQFNAAAYYVDAVRAPTVDSTAFIAPYVRGDAGLVWRHGSWSLGLWGQNLFRHDHVEFADRQSASTSEIPRSVVGKMSWSF